MNKPTFEELENKIATQKTTIERLKKRSDQYSDLVSSIPKIFKISGFGRLS